MGKTVKSMMGEAVDFDALIENSKKKKNVRNATELKTEEVRVAVEQVENKTKGYIPPIAELEATSIVVEKKKTPVAPPKKVEVKEAKVEEVTEDDDQD